MRGFLVDAGRKEKLARLLCAEGKRGVIAGKNQTRTKGSNLSDINREKEPDSSG